MNSRLRLHLARSALFACTAAFRLAAAETSPAAKPPPPAAAAPTAPGAAPPPPPAGKETAKDAAQARPSVALPMTTRFNQTRARIDALFAQRNAPPPAASARSNPFRPAGPMPAGAAAPPVAPAGAGSAPAAAEGARSESGAAEPAVSSGLLQQSTATLKFSGMFERGGVVHVVINKRSYKEGDVVPTSVNGEPVYLRVKAVAGRSVVLSLDGAETTLNF
jgi:hypothetical protein